MNLKRFILASLLSVCLGCFSASCVFAYLATTSDAVPGESGLDESDFIRVIKYLPSSSKQFLVASGGLSAVGNSIDRSLVRVNMFDSNGLLIGVKNLDSNGSFSYVADSKKIHHFIFNIPSRALPVAGNYQFSYSFNSDVAFSYSDIKVQAFKTGSNTWTGITTINNSVPNHQNNAGEFRRDPMLIEFRQLTGLNILCYPDELLQAVGGRFAMSFVISLASGGDNVGFTVSDSDLNAQTADNTAQLVEIQNETNGKLDQIVQHISDQLAALWNQMSAYLITPWMKQDRDLHSETIDKLDDLDTNVTTTIQEETSWHANFIIEGLKNLFIPSDDYYQTKISEMQDFFEEKLGFLGYTLTYFIRLLNGIMNASQNSVIRFPGIHAPNRATGEDYVLLPAQDVDLGAQISQISEGNFNLLEFCRTAGDIVLVLSFLVLLQDKLREVEK